MRVQKALMFHQYTANLSPKINTFIFSNLTFSFLLVSNINRIFVPKY